MTTVDAEDAALPEEDRLPWLESVDDSADDGPSPARALTAVIIALLVVAVAIFAYGFFRAARPAAGIGGLIDAPKGAYKVKPDQPGGMKVDGEGDTVFATSEGQVSNGSVDTAALPETPVVGKTPAASATPVAGASKVITTVPPPGGALTARKPTVIVPPLAAGGGSALIQLGSFPTEGQASTAWAQLSKRFGYLAPLGKSVERADVNGGTVYRLRVNAGSAGSARELCGRLKVAGEACFVPN